MRPAGLGAALLLAAGALGCRKPAPVDPAVEAYHAAVLRFAETSRITQDLTYRDRRFDPILDALDNIPAGSEPKAEAQALADRIRGARAEANAQQPSSDRMQAEAAAPPVFEPMAKLQALAAPRVAVTAVQMPGAAPGGDEVNAGGPVAKGQTRHLPPWYAGYFGTPGTTPEDAGDKAQATGESVAPEAPAPRRPAAKPADTSAPPQVFGLPGPAGNALQGRPETSK